MTRTRYLICNMVKNQNTYLAYFDISSLAVEASYTGSVKIHQMELVYEDLTAEVNIYMGYKSK